MEKWKVDVPVLLIFFTRPDTFKQVFEKVREAKPSKVFLACDGPRTNHSDDIEKIEQCKQIANGIDWECEIYQDYATRNLGCGVRPQSAIGWALSIVDRIVILEDDCVPELSFFDYAAELLERYKDDSRVGMISGLNHLKEWDCGGTSYCFTKTGAIWGWATWRRVWNDYDYALAKIKNEHVQSLLTNDIPNKVAKKKKVKRWLTTNALVEQGEKISYWDSQFGFLKNYYSYLAIVPKHNLIFNIGVGEGSTHALASQTKKWSKGSLHFIPIAPIDNPLIHPDYVICDRKYDEIVERKWLSISPCRFWWQRIVRMLNRIFKR